MTLTSMLSMFVAMIVLAAIPGPGIMIVVARAASRGFAAGLTTSFGIVAGDFVFILLAAFGLTALSQLIGEFFIVVKVLGAAYLIWLGLRVILSKRETNELEREDGQKHSANFLAGLLTTLSNPKAIVFYASFFPAFLDLSTIDYLDISLLLLIATVAVGGVMSLYALFAVKLSSRLQKSRSSAISRYAAGSILIGSGAYVATRS